MYLSRIPLDVKRRDTLIALDSPQLFHGAIESSYQGKRTRNLWRIDWLNNVCYLLVLSKNENIDFSHVVKQFGYPNSKWETKSYNNLLKRLKDGQTWQFRLKANPVHSSMGDKDKLKNRGRLFAHVTHNQQKAWLRERSEKNGFILNDDGYNVVKTEWVKFRKGNSKDKVTIKCATFEGFLTITDVETFVRALTNGIGRSKAYGCGLLSIANVQGNIND